MKAGSKRASRRATFIAKQLSRTALGAAALSATLGLASTAQAASLYWDDNASVAGGGGATAVGTWGTSSFWNTDVNGGAGTFSATVGAGNTAVFSAGTDVTGTYTVTVSGTQTTGGITFEEGVVTLSGGTGITLDGSPVITVGAGTTNRTATINTVLTAVNEVLLQRNTTGVGTLNLGAANTFNATNALRIGGGVRLNGNVAGSLGTGQITIEGSESAISNDTNTSNITFSNNIVLNPLNAGGFTAGFAGAGNSGTVANFSGTISGFADIYISPTPAASNLNTNGSGMTIFSGNNSVPNGYTGRTIVNNAAGGTFRIGSATALPATTSLVFGRAGTNAGQNVGGADLNGFNISVVSIATEQPTGNTVAGITNSNGGAGGNITVTGGLSTTFTGLIGAFSTTSLTTAGTPGTNNLSLTLAPSHSGSLTLTRQNTYTGATTIGGGTLVLANTTAGQNTVAGPVIVDNTATLTTTGGTGFGQPTPTTVGIGGSVTVNSGGTITPGGGGAGVLSIANGLTLNGGSDLTFTIFAPLNHDHIALGSSALTLDAGVHEINLDGTVVAGTYTLANYGSVTPGSGFVMGSVPAGFNYIPTLGANSLTLQINPATPALVWDIGGGGSPIVEGAGTWSDGSTDFTDTSDNTGATFSNGIHPNPTPDVTFGNDLAGPGGLITLGSNIRTGGQLIFGPTGAPYTIGDGTTTFTLSTMGGVTANSSASIAAPVALDASQTWKASLGATLSVSGSITDGVGGPAAMTKTGGGILALTGTGNTFSGGLIVSEGTAEANSDAAMGTGALTLEDDATFRFAAGYSTDNAFVVNATHGRVNVDTGLVSSITSNITGAGQLRKTGAGVLGLSGTNTMASILIDNGAVAFNDDSNLGVGDINLDDGVLAPQLPWTTSKNIVTTGSFSSNRLLHNSNAVTLNGAISGPGDFFKDGDATLTLNGANSFTGNFRVEATKADGSAQTDGGTVVTSTINAIGTANTLVHAPFTLNALSDLAFNSMRGSMQLTKTGPGDLILAGVATANLNTTGSIVVNQGDIIMNGRDGLGGANGTATNPQMNITMNAGTELVANWTMGTARRGGSITLNGATFTRPDQVTTNTTNDTEFTSFNGATTYGASMTVSGNSLIRNLDTGTDIGRGNFLITMPVTVTTAAVLTLHNAAVDKFATNPMSLQGNATHPNNLTMQAGSTIITTGTGEVRIGGTTNGKPIIAQGTPGSEALMQLGNHAYMSDDTAILTSLTVNGSGSAGLRIEAPMNATYLDDGISTTTDGTTGLLGLNTTDLSVGNSYTALSPNRLNQLAGTGGTLTIAANDATDATGRIIGGPNAATSVRLAVDNTASSAGANLVYEIDGNADPENLGNLGGLDVKRSSAGAGSVKVKLVNSVTKVPDVTINNGTQIDVNDQKLILTNMTETAVLGLVEDGRNSVTNAAPWNGSGIMTSQTAAIGPSILTSLAVATADDIGKVGSAWAGQTLATGDVLVMYTYNGDANVSGFIDADDYFQIDSNYNKSGTVFGYNKGDFNYDGVINGDDYFLIDNAFTGQGAAFSTAAPSGLAGVSAVPEPGAVSLILAGASALLMRRRRQRSLPSS